MIALVTRTRLLSRRPPAATLAGARSAVPLVPVALAFGTTFGAAAAGAGFDVTSAVAMSALAFAGSAQFATVGVVAAGGAPILAVLAGALMNARYLPMGVVAARRAGGRAWRRFIGAQAMVDESWALAQAEGAFDWSRMVGAGLLLWIGWVTGTLLGALAGPLLADLDRFGIDGAIAGIFAVLAVGQVRSRRAAFAALAGVGLALASVPILPPGLPVLVATAACLLGWRE